MIIFSGTRSSSTAGASGGGCVMEEGRAGVAQVWVIPAAAVTGLRFDADGRLTGVSLRCDLPAGIGWEEVQFDDETGLLTQAQTARNRYNQTLTLGLTGQDQYNRRQINILASASAWHAVVLTEAGEYHYLGIQTYRRGSIVRWDGAPLSCTGNSANSGQGGSQGLNGSTLGFTAIGVHQLAPLTLHPDNLGMACGTGIPRALQVIGGFGTGTTTGGGPGSGGGGATGGGPIGPGGDLGGGGGGNIDPPTAPGDPGHPDNWTDNGGNAWTDDDGNIWY